MSRPLLIQWYECSQCGYETAAWDQVACPKCEVNMSPIGTAGAIFDNRDDRECMNSDCSNRTGGMYKTYCDECAWPVITNV